VTAARAYAETSSPPRFIDPGPARELVEAVEALDAEKRPAPRVDPLDDRRQRAREAYYDRYSLGDHIGGSARKAAIRECIETATRVQITPEVLAAAREAWRAADGSWTEDPGPRETARLAAAFRAAGFKVEE